MVPNFLVIAACSLIPFLVAFIWYSPSLFGGDNWTSMADIPADKASPVKPLYLGLSVVLNLLIAFGMFVLANHELGVVGMIGGDMEIAKTGTTAAFLAEFGGKFHNFGHGVVHGVIATVLFAIPFVGYDTIFSKKSGKYFLVNMGFWLISLCLVGGVVSQWGAMPLN